MTVATYINTLNLRYKTGISREHTYRGDLQTLLMTMLPEILVTNEPSRVNCGAPDYVLTKKDVPVGYIEAKDIGVDLNSKTLKEQFDRYRSGLSNLVFTDYLDFHFYKDGVFTTSVAIAKIEQGSIVPLPDNFGTFEALIKNFSLTVTQTIKSPTKLAEMMAGKAKLMADVIERSLNSDDANETQSALKSQMLSFKQMLIHDITNSAFADIYAQTIATVCLPRVTTTLHCLPSVGRRPPRLYLNPILFYASCFRILPDMIWTTVWCGLLTNW